LTDKQGYKNAPLSIVETAAHFTYQSVGQDISNKASTVLWRSFAGPVLDKV